MTQRNKAETTRRELLTGMGLAAGMASMPGLAQSTKAAPRWDHETDIVCVGGGAAGCTAAVTAASKGSQVILVERAPILGGTTRKSGGVAWVPNHPLMRELNMEDRREDCLRYMSRFAYPHRYNAKSPALGLDPQCHRLLEAFYDNGASMLNHLKSLGVVEFGLFTVGNDPKPSPDYADHLPENKLPAGRALAPKDAQGKTMSGNVGHGGRIVDACEEWLTAHGGKVLTEHRVTQLIRDGERIVGVEAETGGKLVRIRARKAVMFGTGGFAHNTDLIGRHQRMLYGSCAVPQSTGDFVEIATAVGARLGSMDTAWRTQVVFEQALQNRVLGVGVFFVPGDSMLLVNKYGRRVVNEKRDYNDRTRVHFVYDPVNENYPNQLLFMLFDRRTLDAYGGAFPIPTPGQKVPYLIEGASWTELAANLQKRLDTLANQTGGISLAPGFVTTLSDTLKRFNEYAKSGRDPEFDRGTHSYDREWQGFFSPMREGTQEPVSTSSNRTMYPLREQGPYYAVILAPGALDTNAGPVINEKAQVIGSKGKPIPGLYAAGNCVASPTGDAYMGAGGTVGPAMTFGYIAGMNAAMERPAG